MFYRNRGIFEQEQLQTFVGKREQHIVCYSIVLCNEIATLEPKPRKSRLDINVSVCSQQVKFGVNYNRDRKAKQPFFSEYFHKCSIAAEVRTQGSSIPLFAGVHEEVGHIPKHKPDLCQPSIPRSSSYAKRETYKQENSNKILKVVSETTLTHMMHSYANHCWLQNIASYIIFDVDDMQCLFYVATS